MNSDLPKNIQNFLEKKLDNKLLPKQARLYSQFSQLSMRQPGLQSWVERETFSNLRDALEFINFNIFIRDHQEFENYTLGFRRAGEVLEWLSHSKIKPQGIPTALLAAACYQLAGLPARASGLSENYYDDQKSSEILKSFLKTDFLSLLLLIGEYWSQRAESEESSTVTDYIVDETVRSLGIFCAEVRWGDQTRINAALEKLAKIYQVVARGGDSYSWLMSYLSFQVATTYQSSLLRYQIQKLSQAVSLKGQSVFERYIRQSYLQKQSLAWPSQSRGIEKLANGGSFALCTPTASGKTSVAELAILKSLFAKDELDSGLLEKEPIALYLVPSRALAFQLEAKLSRVIEQVREKDLITVTGLYGGNDWGPTDAWLTANNRTVLICTYEKAEALIRFLGPLFVSRLALVIIDEAHQIIYDKNSQTLEEGDNRGLRLEALAMRLLNYVSKNQNSKVVALSAAAFGAEDAITGWATGDPTAQPDKVNYRSTRQLIGQLICKPDRNFEIRYDILDGVSLEFSSVEYQSVESPAPYVPNPFPPFPETSKKLEQSIPTLLRLYTTWAALNFAASETQPSILISLTEGLDDFSKTLISLVENYWIDKLPSFFSKPSSLNKQAIWNTCLESCEDYFGKNSIEYRLLEKGIIVHQGQIPGKISKWLLDAISMRIVRVVVATSTLTDGVNLPFEVILIPKLARRGQTMPIQEFENLVGRAGRPGVSTEGKSLAVVFDKNVYSSITSKSKKTQKEITASKSRLEHYLSLKTRLLNKFKAQNQTNEISPLVALIDAIRRDWEDLHSNISFERWLEITVPLEIDPSVRNSADKKLDTLDGILLPAIVEADEMYPPDVQINSIEDNLRKTWARSFAKYASQQEKIMEEIFIKRGLVLAKKYPKKQRHQFYSTGLSPRHASQLIEQYENIRQEMGNGFEYLDWDSDKRFNYIRNVVAQINKVSKFTIPSPGENLNVDWDQILHWWLSPHHASIKPNDNVSMWLKYISNSFVYRIGWGIGSVFGLISDEIHGGQIGEFNLSLWAETKLPWAAFWIKELLHWGTLDPVASYLISTGLEDTRDRAEQFAQNYYQDNRVLYDANELLDPRTVRDWITGAKKRVLPQKINYPPDFINVTLLRDFGEKSKLIWHVVPAVQGDKLIWLDVAGYQLATSFLPENWDKNFILNFDFSLYPDENKVQSTPYL